jgi:hypothetical protein
MNIWVLQYALEGGNYGPVRVQPTQTITNPSEQPKGGPDRVS